MPTRLPELLAVSILSAVVGCAAEPPVKPARVTRPTELPLAMGGGHAPASSSSVSHGIRVRMNRRSATSGLVTVHEERVSDDVAAAQRRLALEAQGWSPFPLEPAPELASVAAQSNPELAECPYLALASEGRADVSETGEARPQRIVCYRTAVEFERGLDRERFLREHDARLRSCVLSLAGDLGRGLSVAARRAIIERCEATAPTREDDVVEVDAEVVLRTRRNRQPVRLIRQP